MKSYHFLRYCKKLMVGLMITGVLTVVSMLILVPTVSAAPFTVNSNFDTVDANTADGICQDALGKCTLRAAIMQANALAGADVIIMPPGTYTLFLAGTGENASATGDLDITGDLTIIGANGDKDGDRNSTIIEAGSIAKGGVDRVFQVNPGGTGVVQAAFQALTIRNGNVPGTSFTGSGGGIEFETLNGASSLSLYNVVITQNKTAATGYGGGIDLYNESTTTAAVVTIEKSVISDNETTQANGGGIFADKIELIIRDSTISGNQAKHPSANSLGGGLYLNGSISQTTIQRSLFYNNQVNSGGDGGAIRTVSAALTIENSTFSGNFAGSDGGAIDFGGSKNLTMTNVTVTANTASGGNGGGLNLFGTGTKTIRNSIVYGNNAITNPNINGTVNSASSFNNIIGSSGTGGLSNGTNGNLVGVNPNLGPLASNGGPTQTHKLVPGSPAIDAGNNLYVAGTLDQRGRARTVDSMGETPEDTTAEADIGAYELYPTIGAIANQSGMVGSTINVPVTVAGTTTIVTAASSNSAVVPNDAAHLTVLNPTSTTPTVQLKGAVPGVSTITVTVTSDGESATSTWTMTVTAETTAPMVTNGTISASALTDSSVTLSWTKATDNITGQGALQYLVYRSGSNNMDTVSNIEANGTAIGSFAADIGTLNVIGLTANTTYYFNIIVKDEAGNKTAYTMKQVKTNETTYTVVFDKNGGDTEASPASKTATHGGNVGTLPSEPTRAGYAFAGWNTSADGSGSTFTAATTVTGNQTVYAQWTVNTYTVTFDKNGGDTEASPASKTATHGGNVGTLPSEPTRAGYAFAGWNTEADGSGATFTATTTVTGDQTVYAQWTINTYSVAFDKNGGDTEASPASKTATHGGNVGTLPSEPTRAGYAFAGWNTSADGSGATFTAATTVTGNQTVYAQWTLNTYTVTFDKNGGDTEASPASKTATHGGNVGSMPSEPTRAGYTFAGWNTLADGSGATFTAATAVTGDQTVYAQWTINTYTVTFDKNGGDTEASPASKTANHGGNVGTLPSEPTRAGYAFAGWNTSADGSGASFTATTAVSGNQTVYAQWTVNTYTVTFDKNGGDTEASPTTKTVTHGGNVGSLPSEPTRAGYTFAGWNTSADGSGAMFTAATAVTGDQTVHAQWTINTYTVTFDKNGGDTEASPTTKTATHGGNVGTLPSEPTRAGYAFAGWNTSADGSGATFTAATAVTGDQTVYAQWTQNTHLVSYEAGSNGVISSTSELVAEGGHPAAVPMVTPSSGYTFVGWSSDGGATKITSAQVAATTVTAPITYTAFYILNIPGVPIIQTVEEGDAKVGLGWSPAEGATAYKIYQSVTSNTYGTEVLTVTGSVYHADVTGLTNGTTYYFVVKAVNDGGESAASNEVTATPKTVPAAPTNIVATAGNGQAIISFTPPAINGGSIVTGYQVISDPGNIMATGTSSPITITGLSNGTSYTFTVKAINSVGSSPASAVSNAIIPSAPPNDGGGAPTTPPSDTPAVPEPPRTTVEVLVNGKAENAGTATTTNRNNQTVTTIAVDQKKMEAKLAAEGQGSVITIPVINQSDVVVGELSGQMVKIMEEKKAIVEIKTENATYTLPAEQIDISAISDQIGQPAALQDIKVTIEIAKPAADMVKVVENSAVAGEFMLMVPPLEFTVKATSGDKTVEITKFNAYVERTIAIPDGVDPNKITTGVVVEADGTVRHVPTKIIIMDGKYYAKVNSLTNSAYSIVWHPLEFMDVAQHWAKEAVNDMGSRMVVNGITEDLFLPDQDITRAEYAAIMVRALGLRLESGAAPFTDVNPSEWYNGAIRTAYTYNLINGFEDGTFRPSEKITREQVMMILSKAMTLTHLKEKLPNKAAGDLLSSYADSADVSEWAKKSVTDSLEAGIVSGRTETELAPKAYITRAEVAVVIQRLLQKSELI